MYESIINITLLKLIYMESERSIDYKAIRMQKYFANMSENWRNMVFLYGLSMKYEGCRRSGRG